MGERLYSSCIQSFMFRGSEMCRIRKENEVTFQQAEMRMVRWICDIKVKERVSSKDLRETRIR